MKRAQNWLLTVLAVAPLAAAGCGDETPGKSDTSTTSTTDATSPTDGDGTNGTDSTNPPTDATGDTTGPTCGTRVCGTFAGLNCGTCDPGEVCTSSGQCEDAGDPMGSFCGITSTCKADSPSFPDCIDAQCASRNCLSLNPTALALRDVCSSGCQIYQDEDQNGVNDADAPLDDCNPDDIVDGPAGNAFRCVNFAAPGGSPVGLCVPGSEFIECQSNADCPAGEGCELSTIGGDYNFRCMANYQENGSWTAEVVGLGEACNDDPEAGTVSYCGSGLCFGLGCVTACEQGSDCLTDTCNTGTGKCTADTTRDCTADADCSGWECGEARQILGDGQGGLAGPFWELCWPKSCELDTDCGSNHYCRFFWNSEGGEDAALDNLCLAQNPDGVGLGEACDPNPDDNVPGATCKNEDLCIGGFCSNLCKVDGDCGTDQVCAVAELPGDFDEDGEDDFVLPVQWCQTYPGATDQCRSDADCGAGESCQIYEVVNTDAAGADDAQFLFAGLCQDVSAQFPGTAGDFGATCTGGAECKSGFCLGATDTAPGFCTAVCASSADCGTATIQGDTFQGICASLLYGYGGTFNDSTDVVYVPLCIVTTDSLEDCSGDFDCTAANEVCFHNVVATDAAHAPTVELLCSALVEEGGTMPTGAVGSECDLEPAEDAPPECAGGYCLEGADGKGYCSELCATPGNACAGGTTCTETKVFARAGEYADNSATINLCRKDPECEPCFGNFNCANETVCANLGTTNTPDFRCVPGCATADDCTGEQATTCNASADERGEANMGCFAKNGNVPVNYCAQ
ncbi:MAG: hypothetical protein IT373_35825 [Polyangiaceae bacterium]|nr:hypothetical protein [Polyangiaceae bacterium]